MPCGVFCPFCLALFLGLTRSATGCRDRCTAKSTGILRPPGYKLELHKRRVMYSSGSLWRLPPEDRMTSYDAVIIGAGIAGLIAGASRQ